MNYSYSAREEHKDRFVFVLGNTKYVRDCTQAEREFLYNNGRKSWFVKKIDDNSGGILEPAALPEATIEEQPEVIEEVIPAVSTVATKATTKKK